MRLIALFVFFVTSSISVFAAQNPQIRACRIAGGEFMVMRADNDQLGLCKFELSLVGAIDILVKASDASAPQSLAAFKDGVRFCEGTLTSLTSIPNGDVSVSFCRYADGSLIDMDTLTTGRYNPRNSVLAQSLGL